MAIGVSSWSGQLAAWTSRHSRNQRPMGVNAESVNFVSKTGIITGVIGLRVSVLWLDQSIIWLIN
jgi:hypothetical protein